MELRLQFRNLGRFKRRRWILVVMLMAVTHLSFQSFLLPYGKAIRSLLPEDDASKEGVEFGVWSVHSSAKSMMVRNPLTVNASDLIDSSTSGDSEEGVEDELVIEELDQIERFEEVALTLDENGSHNTSQDVRDIFPDERLLAENGGDMDETLTRASVKDMKEVAPKEFSKPNVTVSEDGVIAGNISNLGTPIKISQLESASVNGTTSLSRKSSSLGSVVSVPGEKKMACNMPPKTVTTFGEMNNILARNRAKSRSMRPRWSSKRDQEILAAKTLIENAPPVTNDRELYAPLFRNISMFKKSYELMERTLKVYVYKEGDKPIFHQPVMKGLYASEGWFMKLMEGDRRFAVKDPRRAHLFYMPFSSRTLQHELYVRNSHNRTILRRYLKDYSEKIAAKYSYWNRTGGADHFLVACHDWAPYETRHHMERCPKALCNADVTAGFKLGRDVSLPETYVRSARNPLRDLGGKPPTERHITAFYAGNLHGYLRPILLRHWKDKHPDMKILGPMPPGVATKISYINFMKSSKYCLCPKGYEVNSPRVVEAVFYECVPVIISDNFVPPFFEVLNWEAFSVILAEKDVPRLKEVLDSIPREKYLTMQLAVRKAQKHFLWHAKPVKYDLFHMTLHSIWYNRVFQIKAR